MTEQEYTERNELIDNNNELIAIFDGWELIDREGVQRFIKYGYRLYHYELRYNTDWAKLMPIWQKFRDLRIEDLKAEIEHSGFKLNISYCICYRDIDSAFQAIVSGIQWYNELNKNNKCGSIILFEEDKDVTRDQLINTPLAFNHLLKQGFDLFKLIENGLAIDSKTLK